MAQLVERLLLTPEIRGSNPDKLEILSTNCRKDENKEIEVRNGPSLKKAFQLFQKCEGGDTALTICNDWDCEEGYSLAAPRACIYQGFEIVVKFS